MKTKHLIGDDKEIQAKRRARLVEGEFEPPPDPHRERQRIPEARLAHAVLLDALTMSHKIRSAKGPERREALEAAAWLTDTESKGPFSLEGVCAWLELSSGEVWRPEAIAEATRRTLGPIPDRSAWPPATKPPGRPRRRPADPRPAPARERPTRPPVGRRAAHPVLPAAPRTPKAPPAPPAPAVPRGRPKAPKGPCLTFQQPRTCATEAPELPTWWCVRCWSRGRQQAGRNRTFLGVRRETWRTVLEMFPGEFRRKDWAHPPLPPSALGLLVLVGSLKLGTDPILTHAAWRDFGMTREHVARLYSSRLWNPGGTVSYEWLDSSHDGHATVGILMDAMAIEGTVERLVYESGEVKYRKAR